MQAGKCLDGYLLFEAKKEPYLEVKRLTLQLIGFEMTEFGHPKTKFGKKEIINVCYDVSYWDSDSQKRRSPWENLCPDKNMKKKTFV